MITPDKFSDCNWQGADTEALIVPYQVNPTQYLKFAKADLSEQIESRSLVNAVSNAKRALHLRVDIITDALGFKCAKLKNNFPTKMSFCEDCGVSGRRIITKINRFRNVVEHDYYVPTQEECEDFVDVTELFLISTTDLSHSFPRSVTLASKELEELYGQARYRLSISLPPSKGVISVFAKELDENFKLVHQEAEKVFEKYNRWLTRSQHDSGRDQVLPTEDQLRKSAYMQACENMCNKTELQVTAAEGRLYTDWLRFLIAKTRES